MFTIDQIKAAHLKVKSGSDFPAYIRDLKQLGVISYETLVKDGQTIYAGSNHFQATAQPKYALLHIAEEADSNQFISDLKAHQQGKTDYPTFCADCAKSGVEKWAVSLEKMTCTYYDKKGNELIKEQIPS